MDGGDSPIQDGNHSVIGRNPIKSFSVQGQLPKMEDELVQTPSATPTEALAEAAAPAKPGRGSKNMTYAERCAMLDFLLQRRHEGSNKLARHAVTDAAAEFKVDRRTVSRLWKRAVQSMENGDAVTDVASRKVGHRGRRKRDWSAELERVKQIPLEKRGSIRALASAVGIPKTTLFELLKQDKCPTRVIDSIKPPLTDKNRMDRLRYCYSKVRENGLFDDMLNVVHINMKGFSLAHDKKLKVMCMAAVARPQWDPQRNAHFDGKIGIWPFLREQVEPVESDCDVGRQQVTPQTVPVETVTKDDVQRMITSTIMPAIREKMPAHMKGYAIFIQQDNAKVRSSVNDAAFAEEGQKDGWNIQMQSLPPYSPDFTVMDYALFKPIQASLKELPPVVQGVPGSGLHSLLLSVQRGFSSLTSDEINDAFLTLQKILECTMRVQGSNTYELGPTGKAQLEHEGSLPISILCHPDAVVACRAALHGSTEEVI